MPNCMDNRSSGAMSADVVTVPTAVAVFDHQFLH
jgi:hypothetical protein